jgi:NAD(P)-dependent dehydrogenase (short-subunit alcohol dehydrogenase family)
VKGVVAEDRRVTEPVRKALFVTGGGSGIGRAVARYFAGRGWFVGLADIDEGGMAETAALLAPDACSRHLLDVRDWDGWDGALADFVSASGGRLDVLFNNAGIAHGGPLVEHTRGQVDDLLDINLRGVIYGALAGYPHLKATPGSCLLNTCSAAGLYGAPGMAVYSASKFGVRALTEALEIEWSADGIKVRDLMPGFIDTPLLAGPAGRSNISKRQRVIDSGLEFTPVEQVAQAAWDAVHRNATHTLVGKTAQRMAFGARWMPGRVGAQLARFAGLRR